MNIAVVGTGYVGLVSGACFAEMGVTVSCIDTDRAKIEGLCRGVIPIYEPGLEEIVTRNYEAGRLRFTTDLSEVIDEVEIVFIAVGTPPEEDGSADLSHVESVARQIGRTMNRSLVIVTKSTVPVGTSDLVRGAVTAELAARGIDIEFDVASNPEFLKEGDAVKDFMSPDRVVVGVASEGTRMLMERLYKPFMLNSYRMIFTDIRSAEMIKYAANAMLATRISFINDIAGVCELVGADVNMVRKGIGTDHRIGGKFLYPGLGYGGSCFPKDIKALLHTATQNGYRMELLEAVEHINSRQKGILADKVMREFGGELSDKAFGVWGLAFKPETDDVREAPAFVIIQKLLVAGATVKVYDPAAMDTAREKLAETVTWCEGMYDAAEGVDGLILVTEWKEFRLPDWGKLAEIMRGRAIFDGRNIYDRRELTEKGFRYFGIGLG
jgi:UDPglucose 6-dehydrogenase